MALRDVLKTAAAALLGVSTYQGPSQQALSQTLDDAQIAQLRRYYGGQLQPMPQSITRWYMTDLERAEISADYGDLSLSAMLMRSARRDGQIAGVLSTRTDGLVRLPKRFRGDAEVIAALELGHDSIRSVFDEVLPPTDLAKFVADGVFLGVAVGELVPVAGRDVPVFQRLDPSFLVYMWNENQWYFRSVAGLIPITPGDGHWVLHTPGGRNAPWQHGLWRAIGRSYIRKEHAALRKDDWEAKLANPARVAMAPPGAAEAQRQGFFEQVASWGINTVFEMTPGWEVKLIESNGRGYESFCKTIADQNVEITIALAGQTVTTDGGAGFANADIHKSIRADLIKSDADQLAYTVNTQVIPALIAVLFGPEYIESKATVVEWDVTPPKDRNSEATAMVSVANAIVQLTAALQQYGQRLDIAAMSSRFGIPILNDSNGDGRADDTSTDDNESTAVPDNLEPITPAEPAEREAA
jgi:hypothetical protein